MKHSYHGPLNNQRQRFLSLINFDKKIVKAKGNYLYSAQGEAFLDFTSQFGAVSFGHNPDFLWNELRSSSNQFTGVMIQPFESPSAADLARQLIHVAPGNMKHVSFACSGAEGVEIALKMARCKTKRVKILSTLNGFHGKTMGACLATGNPYYRQTLYPSNNEFDHIPYSNIHSLEAALKTRDYAAFIVEPIQGEGGMVVPEEGYLQQCQELCRRYGSLLIVDEVQTGLGRTGSLFACDLEKIEPDIIVIAKALSGGLIPISACIANNRSWSADFCRRHSSTFANNGLAAQMGCAVLRRLTQDKRVLAHINRTSTYLRQGLETLVHQFPTVFASVSGRGLMQGLALAPWHDDDSYLVNMASNGGYAVALAASYLLNRHAILTAPTLNSNHVLRIQPGYSIRLKHIDRLIVALTDLAVLVSSKSYETIFRAAMGLADNTHRVTDLPRITQRNRINAHGACLGRFAFLMHPTTIQDILNSLPNGSQAYRGDELAIAESWVKKLKSVEYDASIAYSIPAITSARTGYVQGWLISSPLLPSDMMRLSKEQKQKLLRSYIDIAKSKNVDIIGLGAFTSVISRSGQELLDYDIPLTTGNSYTALSCTDSIRSLCRILGRSLSEQCLAVVGALGSVGRLATLDLAPDCGAITLIGNARRRSDHSKLEVLGGELIYQVFIGEQREVPSVLCLKLKKLGINAEFVLSHCRQKTSDGYRNLYVATREFCTNLFAESVFPIHLSNDITVSLPHCNIIVTATSNGEAFIDSSIISQDAIVCDVARPSDVQNTVKESRPDVLVYEGGLIEFPDKQIRFGGPNILNYANGINLACLSETIILCMQKSKRSFSIGATPSLLDARNIFTWAKQHGFKTHIPNLEMLSRNCDIDRTQLTTLGV